MAFMKKQQIDALWAHVHWLGVLADTGSYTAAAQRLAVSKPAMSQRISELEAAAGVPLVRRTTRSVRLTEAGQSLVDSTRGAFAQIERSFVGVRDLAETPQGLLRVTVAVGISTGGEAVLSVSDDSQKIPIEERQRIFERFHRASAQRETRGEGAGLGLAITRSIVRAHGGEIAARSAGGQPS